MKDVIKIKKPNQVSNVKVSHEASSYYAELSKQWATRLDKPIQDEEYSSKYYAKVSEQNAHSANDSANRANEVVSGIGKLVANSLYFPEFKISNDETVLNNLKRQKSSSFDQSKFTIVGNPTITNDGIVSGFSKNDYLYIPNSLSNTYNTFEIMFKFHTAATRAGAYIIGGGANSHNFLIAWTGAGYFSLFLSSDNSTWDVAYSVTSKMHVVPNSDYWMKFIFDGTKYIVYISTDGINYSPEILVNSSVKANIPTNLLLGCVWGGVTNYTYTLSELSIIKDGKEVFNGKKTKIDVIKADNYEITGSPTITDDGIASGFSADDYLSITQNIDFTKPFKIQGRFNSGNTSLSQCLFYIGKNVSSGDKLIIGTHNDGYPIMYYPSNTSVSWQRTSLKISDNTDYYFEFIYDGSQYEFKVGRDKNNLSNTTGKITPNLILDTTCKFIGKNATNTNILNGSIDLNSLKIYIYDKLVYQTCLKIPYTQSKTGSKIVDSIYRDRIQDLYEQVGYTHYYTLGEEDYTLGTCKGTAIVEEGEVNGIIYTRTADLTLTQRGSCTNGTAVKLLPYKDKNSYQISTPYSEKTQDSFTPSATGDFIAIGKTVLE